jgi:hypothetical protein
MVQRAALAQSFNEAWMLLALLFLFSFCAIGALRARSFSTQAYAQRNRCLGVPSQSMCSQ